MARLSASVLSSKPTSRPVAMVVARIVQRPERDVGVFVALPGCAREHVVWSARGRRHRVRVSGCGRSRRRRAIDGRVGLEVRLAASAEVCAAHALHGERGLGHGLRLVDPRRAGDGKSRQPARALQPAGQQRAAAAGEPAAALDEAVHVLALQADAVAERGKPAGEVGEPSERKQALGADDAEHGGRQAVEPVADDAAEAVPERPAPGDGQHGEAAGEQQHRQREHARLAAVGEDALGDQQLDAPEHGREQEEDGGKAQRVEHHVGEHGADRAEKVARLAARGVREARVRLRPGEEARPGGADPRQEQGSGSAAEPSEEPVLHRRRKQASRVAMGLEWHVCERTLYARTITKRSRASPTVAASWTNARRT